ncbi:hypothetical protein DYB28_007250 [Aphanomyces astaci]|uniref:Uncharacterized protein n=1 Tax=Aphanomyces astaci TaxID=112090 RepID=A0A397DYR3_APHAT|nr:hypothetical protein DYB36_006602 [Aphanomyces astaci]RHY72432.1 hypothetical protein DYB38_012747 [Aphanomyces astaci]RHZ16831.1 hypothetical protein DYB31_014649 [Aphanomyces astaci]RHZ35173.1 hypothetical protein DYB26_010519 [Aphanomyces astaci]RLO06136.1 hypothetical protein DYB28_007250 [Aphanomyces astaci]
MAANSKDPNVQLLAFNGNKKSFSVWTQKFIQHLKAMTMVKVGLCLLSKVLSDTFTQQFKDAFGEAQPVHLLWATIEQYYEESNVNTVKTLVGQLI